MEGAYSFIELSSAKKPIYKLFICKSPANAALLQWRVTAIESVPGHLSSDRMLMLNHELENEDVEARFIHAGGRRIDFKDYINNSADPMILVLVQ